MSVCFSILESNFMPNVNSYDEILITKKFYVKRVISFRNIEH